MKSRILFSQINFNPEERIFSIWHNGESSVEQINLEQEAVKLKVTKENEQYLVIIERRVGSSFPTEDFEIKTRFSGSEHNANLFFDVLDTPCPVSIGEGNEIGFVGEFHVMFVGVDDLRNNLFPPKGLFLMEQEIISIEIKNSFLYLKYHSDINTN